MRNLLTSAALLPTILFVAKVEFIGSDKSLSVSRDITKLLCSGRFGQPGVFLALHDGLTLKPRS